MKIKKVLFFLNLFAISFFVNADGPRMGVVPTIVKQECSACHIVYPPMFLPRQSWKNILSGLDKHYGVDASVDQKSLQKITDWIMRDAGTYKRVSNLNLPPEDRLTTSAWFISKHDEVRRDVWNRISIKSAANCVACHGVGAEVGNYSEHDIRIPK